MSGIGGPGEQVPSWLSWSYRVLTANAMWVWVGVCVWALVKWVVLPKWRQRQARAQAQTPEAQQREAERLEQIRLARASMQAQQREAESSWKQEEATLPPHRRRALHASRATGEVVGVKRTSSQSSAVAASSLSATTTATTTTTATPSNESRYICEGDVCRLRPPSSKGDDD